MILTSLPVRAALLKRKDKENKQKEMQLRKKSVKKSESQKQPRLKREKN